MVIKQIAEIERIKKLDEQWDIIRKDINFAEELAINDFVKENTRFESIVDLYNQACQHTLGHQDISDLTRKNLDAFISENSEFKSMIDLKVKFDNFFKKINKGA